MLCLLRNLIEKIDLFLARALFCYQRSLNQQKDDFYGMKSFLFFPLISGLFFF